LKTDGSDQPPRCEEVPVHRIAVQRAAARRCTVDTAKEQKTWGWSTVHCRGKLVAPSDPHPCVRSSTHHSPLTCPIFLFHSTLRTITGAKSTGNPATRFQA